MLLIETTPSQSSFIFRASLGQIVINSIKLVEKIACANESKLILLDPQQIKFS
jgi:hypothetical protein